jgi:putative hydrolase of the HAD superfamily
MSDSFKKVVLCDLGGVLIDLHWMERAQGLFGRCESAQVLKDRWLGLRSARDYEAGKTDFAGFYRMFVEFSDFRREFAGIIGPVKPGCLDILDETRQKYLLAMLSNTNPVHVEMLRQSSDIFRPFSRLFFSYEMGMVKPDKEIFMAVQHELAVDAGQIIFFDDSELNVVAAQECGFAAFRVESPQQIQEILGSL